MNSTDLAKKIYDTLHRQKFADWYGDAGSFGRHVTGDEPLGKTVEEMLVEIKEMFNLVDIPGEGGAKAEVLTPTGKFDVSIRFTGRSPILGIFTYEFVILSSSIPDKVKVGSVIGYSETEVKDMIAKDMIFFK